MIEIVTETGSTSADLAARIAGGDYLAEGAWLVADRQTAGRGRLGREWCDGAGNFMGSTVVRPRAGDPSAETLALVAGLALYEIVAPWAAGKVMLKWPNDALVEGKKLAGVLLERTGDVVVVGIGANLAIAPTLPDRAAIALADIGVSLSRDDFAELLARQFATELDRWRSFGLAPIVRRWTGAAHPRGTRLVLEGPDGSHIEGRFEGLAESGALQLRLADGTVRAIQAGEVRIA